MSEAPFALPDGCRVAAPPPAEQLVFGSSRGDALIGRRLLYRWEGAGWCLGQVARRNTSAAETVGGSPVNFQVYYAVDGDLASHCLKAESYMGGTTPASPYPPYGTWLLLDEAEAEAAPRSPPAASAAAISAVISPKRCAPQPPHGPAGARRGAAMVGLRISVWWEGDEQWFPGTVREYSELDQARTGVTVM